VGRTRAALGSLMFLVVAPGVAAVLVPWLMTRWHTGTPAWWGPIRIVGVALIAAGVLTLLPAFARFALEGLGTPAPVAPTERLVVGGPYRFVRNPMYLAVLALVVGQALALGRLELLLYAAALAVAFVAFVAWYEEPTLRRRFGDEYEAYRRSVPAWWPRLRPWEPRADEERIGT
jgi:protein-S-isoprenylcysteine O-methyltransferase Ste14